MATRRRGRQGSGVVVEAKELDHAIAIAGRIPGARAGTVAIAVGVVLAAILGYAATRPDTFRVQRTTRIQAPPEKIFDLIHDFHRWASWSPYEKLDPAMRKTFSGAERGKGAVYQWAHNMAEFTLEPGGSSTDVTWALHGPQAYPMKVMCMFMSMDNMVGKDFAALLANLKAVAEK